MSDKSTNPLLSVRGLTKKYPLRGNSRRYIFAVDDISFDIWSGETLGLVGESGCGKSTAGRSILRLIEPTGGRVQFDGVDVPTLDKKGLREVRRKMQIIFQDPYASLNPRMPVGDAVGEPLRNFGVGNAKARQERVADLFARVGLRTDFMSKLPHEFSGGQRQRLGIARALSLDPTLIVADEPVSALDVSVQAQVINLLMDIQRERHLAYLFIAHDLAVVQHVSHRVAIMYLGKIVELAETQALFGAPLHPYTEALLAAVPNPDPDATRLASRATGEIPSPIDRPSGCHFHTRCPYVTEVCRSIPPSLRAVRPGHYVACHLKEPATTGASDLILSAPNEYH
ncbi:oligopeptide/dipeptide ABC transporter ATP-binding protein [Bradyrhizobium sp. NP1]|uniref:ABC transporter ATP-binding protein n=1 Tax=Bradyrhizobium sp. NP1 TaxID=3049772 RepID=UPI0025A4F2AD|nr:oligopeptide/dipeptide ABC transporter ATP-binding protein [Bradyrhizobium sp. NP1]WJR79221.1 ATP-binding cassette domain-containing protein [Bradyrhizobium sp. NP1]